MTSPRLDLIEPASSLYTIVVIGGDAVFLSDRRCGHKLYMGAAKTMSPSELRNYVLSLNHDLERLSTCEFLAKFGLCG